VSSDIRQHRQPVGEHLDGGPNRVENGIDFVEHWREEPGNRLAGVERDGGEGERRGGSEGGGRRCRRIAGERTCGLEVPAHHEVGADRGEGDVATETADELQSDIGAVVGGGGSEFRGNDVTEGGAAEFRRIESSVVVRILDVDAEIEVEQRAPLNLRRVGHIDLQEAEFAGGAESRRQRRPRVDRELLVRSEVEPVGLGCPDLEVLPVEADLEPNGAVDGQAQSVGTDVKTDRYLGDGERLVEVRLEADLRRRNHRRDEILLRNDPIGRSVARTILSRSIRPGPVGEHPESAGAEGLEKSLLHLGCGLAVESEIGVYLVADIPDEAHGILERITDHGQPGKQGLLPHRGVEPGE